MSITCTKVRTGVSIQLQDPIDNRSQTKMIAVKSISRKVGYYNLKNTTIFSIPDSDYDSELVCFNLWNTLLVSMKVFIQFHKW